MKYCVFNVRMSDKVSRSVVEEAILRFDLHAIDYALKDLSEEAFASLKAGEVDCVELRGDLSMVVRLQAAISFVHSFLSSSSTDCNVVTEVDTVVEPFNSSFPRVVVDKERIYSSRGTTVLTGRMDEEKKPMKSRIIVAIRKRPLNSSEFECGLHDAVLAHESRNEMEVREPKIKVDMRKYTHVHRFFFDEVFDESASNEYVYNRTARTLIDTVFEGGCSTCFAYGQTGSGKTHTMLGMNREIGLYALAVRDMFQRMETSASTMKGAVLLSFYEIYGGKLYDLLNDRQLLRCLEDDKKVVNICGLSKHTCTSVSEVMQKIDQGSRMRSSGCTSANDSSSRSHAIISVELLLPGEYSSTPRGKFSFIDLAGSERGADTADCTRQTRMEGAEINKSLLALKECIRFLDQNKKHVPFRGSKLTEVLRDSFIGNCKTVMIGAISPANNSCEHTLNTLRYADRVKELRKSTNSKSLEGKNERSEIVFSDPPPRALRPRRSNAILQPRRATTVRSCSLSSSSRLYGRPSPSSARVPLATQSPNLASLPSSSPHTKTPRWSSNQVSRITPVKRERKEKKSSSIALTEEPLVCLTRWDLEEHYKKSLEFQMNIIKEEYKNLFEAGNGTISANAFVTRAENLIHQKSTSNTKMLQEIIVLSSSHKS